MPEQGTLFVVATPIGNSEDISPRAIEILKNSAVIAAEDTRIANRLFEKLNIIPSRIISFHGHSLDKKTEMFMEFLSRGEDVALIADAGTPCVSDPGGELVRMAHERGYRVSPVPGCSAVTTAFSISGFTGKLFRFGGFFPRKHGDLERLLKIFSRDNSNPVFIFYENPQRVLGTLEVFMQTFPQCELVLTKELTKTYERIFRGTPGEVINELDKPSLLKGEWVFLFAFPKNTQNLEQFIVRDQQDFLDLISRLRTSHPPPAGQGSQGLPDEYFWSFKESGL